jgi:hypothetical protein
MAANTVDLSLYLNELNNIKNELKLEESNAKLESVISCLDDYLDQFNCVNASDILDEDGPNEFDAKNNELYIGEPTQIIDNNVKTKLLFKINELINEQLELLNGFL